MQEPTYPLERIKERFRGGKYIITTTAEMGALAIGFDDANIADCITNHLNETHFYKTMSAEKKPGLMQDVYKIRYQGQRIYLKLQINSMDEAVVVFFKEDEAWIV